MPFSNEPAKKAPDPFVDAISQSAEGVSLLVRVIPRSGTTRIDGMRDGRLLVRLAAAPVDGAANDALVAFFSQLLKMPARNITVAAGCQSRNKRLLLSGTTLSAVTAWVARLTATA